MRQMPWKGFWKRFSDIDDEGKEREVYRIEMSVNNYVETIPEHGK